MNNSDSAQEVASNLASNLKFSRSPKKGLKRFKCVIAYDGTDYCGWQSQTSGGSIQDYLEDRLEKIFGEKIRIHGSGRTDSGVHASAQVFHFDATWKHSIKALKAALTQAKPDSLQIKSVTRASDNFHARYSATGKRYVYRIYCGDLPPMLARYRWGLPKTKLDVPLMNSCAQSLLGEHDFTAFSATRRASTKENPVKTLRVLKVVRRGAEIKVVAEGSGFLYKMVRMLVGALFDVGRGKLSEQDLIGALNSKTRGFVKIQTAPAKGLSLEKVFY